VNPGDRRALHALVLGLQPRRVLEIGTHIGCSTLSLAVALQRTAGKLWTVDIQDVNDPAARPWLVHGSSASPAELAERLGCRQRITFVTADSLSFLGAEQGDPGGFDLIFLDGLHFAAQVYQEIPLALRRLRPGGLILLHDYFPERRPLWRDGAVIAGPWLAIERLRREGAGFDVLPLGRLPWPTKLGSHVTSLALLVRPPEDA
jgi:predicted O-methyltransferase YrrM